MSIGRVTGILGMSTVALLIVGLAACGIGSSPEDALIKDGKATYEKHCLNCHGEARTGEGGLANAPVHGPDGHTWHHPDGQLKELILGTLDYPKKTMPSFVGKLSDSDVDAVLAYLKSNWDSDHLARQEEVTRKFEELNQGEGDQ